MTRIAQTLFLGCLVCLACDADDADDSDDSLGPGDSDGMSHDDGDGGPVNKADGDDDDDDDAAESDGDEGSGAPVPDGFDACDQSTFQEAVVEHCESLLCSAGVDDCVVRYLYLAQSACHNSCSEELFGLLSCVTEDGAVCIYAEDEVCGAEVGLLDFCCAGCV